MPNEIKFPHSLPKEGSELNSQKCMHNLICYVDTQHQQFMELFIFFQKLQKLQVPDLSLQQRRAELEKQREFESVLMAGVSSERRDAMWSKARQQAVSLSLSHTPWAHLPTAHETIWSHFGNQNK